MQLGKEPYPVREPNSPREAAEENVVSALHEPLVFFS